MSEIVMPPHGNSKYPWEKWCDFAEHTVKRGRDFKVEASSFRYALHRHAERNDLKVSVCVREDVVRFTFWKPTPKRKSRRKTAKH